MGASYHVPSINTDDTLSLDSDDDVEVKVPKKKRRLVSSDEEEANSGTSMYANVSSIPSSSPPLFERSNLEMTGDDSVQLLISSVPSSPPLSRDGSSRRWMLILFLHLSALYHPLPRLFLKNQSLRRHKMTLFLCLILFHYRSIIPN